MAFTEAERTDIRRHCGYPAYGSGAEGFQVDGEWEQKEQELSLLLLLLLSQLLLSQLLLPPRLLGRGSERQCHRRRRRR